MRGPKGVVVGVDLCESGDAVARWALDEARVRKVSLTVVHVGQFGSGTAYAPVAGKDLASLRRRSAQVVVDRTMERLRRESSADDVTITTRVVEGDPGPVLVAAAAYADLLVVGSRGNGALARAVLGSVSAYCVHHAACATVVVPTPMRLRARQLRSEVALATD